MPRPQIHASVNSLLKLSDSQVCGLLKRRKRKTLRRLLDMQVINSILIHGWSAQTLQYTTSIKIELNNLFKHYIIEDLATIPL